MPAFSPSPPTHIHTYPHRRTPHLHHSIDLLSEVPPAISFAWEAPESNVMDRPPRNRKVDRLVRPSLLAYCYGQVSAVLPAAAFLLRGGSLL